MQTFSKIDWLKLFAFLVGCTTVGTIVFEGILQLHPFFTVLLTAIGTQFALKFLGTKVIGITYSMTKEKKL